MMFSFGAVLLSTNLDLWFELPNKMSHSTVCSNDLISLFLGPELITLNSSRLAGRVAGLAPPTAVWLWRAVPVWLEEAVVVVVWTVREGEGPELVVGGCSVCGLKEDKQQSCTVIKIIEHVFFLWQTTGEIMMRDQL